MAELFDYKKRADKVTIGYKINESYWNQGIATNVVALLKNYLSNDIGISNIYAFVMPQNTYSGRALLKNNFKKEDYLAQEKNWGGQDVVDVEVYTYTNKK